MFLELQMPNSTQLGDVIKKIMALKDGEYTIEVKKKRKMASMKQRGYYHGILCLAVAVELGWETEDVHEYFKERFNGKEITMKGTGEVITIGASTSAFDTKQYTNLIDQVRIYFLPEIKLDVPTPDEVTDKYVYDLKRAYENRFH